MVGRLRESRSKRVKAIEAVRRSDWSRPSPVQVTVQTGPHQAVTDAEARRALSTPPKALVDGLVRSLVNRSPRWAAGVALVLLAAALAWSLATR